MTRTGPQKIPGANLSLFFGTGQYSGTDMESNCGILHTTEGPSLVDYGDGAKAPNVTGVPDLKDKHFGWWQHYDVDESARALKNLTGGVETNRANAFQIELVGTCDPQHAKTWGQLTAGVDYIYWPAAPDWALQQVAWLMRWLADNHGIPLSGMPTWVAYPGSYGADNGVRMTDVQWRAFKGWAGHQHVPENLHGDPGDIDFARLLGFAKSTEEGSVSLTADDLLKVKTVVHEELKAVPAGVWEYPIRSRFRGRDIAAKFYQEWGDKYADDNAAAFARIEAALAGQQAAITALTRMVGDDVDTAAVVAAVRQAIAEAVVKVDVHVNGEEG